MMIVKKGPTKADMLHNLAAHALTAKAKAKGGDLCNYNYTAGNPQTNNCTEPATQKMIEESSMCEAAAKAACPDESCIGAPFMLGSEFFNQYPMRCFMTEDDPPKWHFNPSGYWPAATEGTPVCVEIEFKNGTKDSNDCGDENYVNVMDEDECRTAATCLAKCIHDQFRVLNATEQDKFPKGCHVAPDGCVEFNTIATDPANPQGTPMCAIA